MSDRVRTETRWQPKGAHVGSFWTVVSVSNDEDPQVGLTGPGPCRAYQNVPLDEFLQTWECVDRCSVCDSSNITLVRVVRETHRSLERPLVHRIVRCDKHLEG